MNLSLIPKQDPYAVNQWLSKIKAIELILIYVVRK